jgi:hypothetical protein
MIFSLTANVFFKDGFSFIAVCHLHCGNQGENRSDGFKLQRTH